MGQFFAMLPKSLLAFVAIAVGTVLILINSPLRNLCDSQIEVINKNMQKFLFEDEVSKRKLSGKKEGNLTTKYERLRDQCDLTNDPGGCYEYFQEMRGYLREMNALTSECAPAVGAIGIYQKALVETLEKMVKIAWGSAPPSSYNVKFNWLDSSDLNLFCRLKDRYLSFFGDEAWERFRLRVSQGLPGAETLNPNQIWDLSIFSESCSRHP
jgi:hypothetical protein